MDWSKVPTDYTHEEIIEALWKSLGIIRDTAEVLSVNPASLRQHLKRNPDIYKEVMDDVRRDSVELAESRLMMLIRSGDFKAIKFFLERKGDYKEEVRHTGAKGGNIPINIIVSGLGELDEYK